MDHILWSLLILSLLALAILSAGHGLINKRDPRSALGWIVACIAIPIFGPLLYWGLGVNRIYSRARRWHREALELKERPKPPSQPTNYPLPPELDLLKELRLLSDRVVSTPLHPGNTVIPLENGEEAYPAMLAAIEKAISSVHLCTYIFDGDVTGRRFTDALIAAAERGVEVRVIVDSLGQRYSKPTAHDLLRRSQVQFRSFLPLRPGGYLNLRNHRKIMVVDGMTGFTGGMNIGNRHMMSRSSRAVADLHFQVSGPVVADLQRTFVDDWLFAKGPPLNGAHYFPTSPRRGARWCGQ